MGESVKKADHTCHDQRYWHKNQLSQLFTLRLMFPRVVAKGSRVAGLAKETALPSAILLKFFRLFKLSNTFSLSRRFRLFGRCWRAGSKILRERQLRKLLRRETGHLIGSLRRYVSLWTLPFSNSFLPVKRRRSSRGCLCAYHPNKEEKAPNFDDGRKVTACLTEAFYETYWKASWLLLTFAE